MRFGLQIETYGEEDTFRRMLAVARLAEEVGFESVWYEDHFSLMDDERPEQPWPQLECMTTLAALAASTETVGIGALVVGVPYRNPALLAKTWTTIDVISRGRAIVGLGAGWNEQEFEAYGYGFPAVGERMEKLEDAIRICDEMMRKSPATLQGAHHSVLDARNDPPPAQRPRPSSSAATARGAP
jgi:alkanesulfonate monooxygenase SsuD/methylene tetrahydromethanopterin reductase-like flavin-dependent oxidoreductase (luciferase family)